MSEVGYEPIPESLLPLPEGVEEDDVDAIIYDGDTPVGFTLKPKSETDATEG